MTMARFDRRRGRSCAYKTHTREGASQGLCQEMILKEAPANILTLISDRCELSVLVSVAQVEGSFSKAPISAANRRDNGGIMSKNPPCEPE